VTTARKGRPPVPEKDRLDRYATTRLTEEDYQFLQELADSHGVTVAEEVRHQLLEGRQEEDRARLAQLEAIARGIPELAKKVDAIGAQVTQIGDSVRWLVARAQERKAA